MVLELEHQYFYKDVNLSVRIALIQKHMIFQEEKKKQFEMFIKQKGIEASNYIKNKKEEEDRKYEELHRCEKKKQTKYEENIKTKKLVKYSKRK